MVGKTIRGAYVYLMQAGNLRESAAGSAFISAGNGFLNGCEQQSGAQAYISCRLGTCINLQQDRTLCTQWLLLLWVLLHGSQMQKLADHAHIEQQPSLPIDVCLQ